MYNICNGCKKGKNHNTLLLPKKRATGIKKYNSIITFTKYIATANVSSTLLKTAPTASKSSNTLKK